MIIHDDDDDYYCVIIFYDYDEPFLNVVDFSKERARAIRHNLFFPHQRIIHIYGSIYREAMTWERESVMTEIMWKLLKVSKETKSI